MATLNWCLLAFLLISVTNGQRYESDSQASYARSESAAPESKEVLLYLTLDQVEKLKATGAVVKPLSESENRLLQQQQQQQEPEQQPKKAEQEIQPQYQPIYTEDSKQEKELENFYKSRVQQIKEQGQSEEATEKPIRYVYALKPNYEEYSKLVSSKKNGKEREYSPEIFQYYSTYGSESPKIESYRTLPIPGYRFEDIKINTEPKKYLPGTLKLRKPVEIKNSKEFRQVISDLTRSLNLEPVQPQQTGEKILVSNIKNTGPVTFNRNYGQSAKNLEPAPVREPQSLSPAAIQRQYSSLLAPLVQQEKIAETISDQKELIKNEREIQENLRNLKESNSHDDTKYAEELEKLKKNLEEQNALAQKLAFETASEKSTDALPKEQESAIKARPAINSWKPSANSSPKPRPVLVRIPNPSAPKWSEQRDNIRPIPEPRLRNENSKLEEPLVLAVQKLLSNSENEEYHIKHEQPFVLQKASEEKYGIPSTLSVLRHIWEH